MSDLTPTSHESPELSASQKKTAYALVGVVLAYYLWGWHKDHVLQYWPFAIFLLCPLMHLFHGHGGHGNGHHQSQSGDAGATKEDGRH